MTERNHGRHRAAPRRRRFTRVMTAVALLGGLALTGGPSEATTVADTFELDGNPQESAALVGDDWETLLNGGGSAEAQTAIPIFDGADSPTDTTYYHGGGSKDTRDIPLWGHSGTDVAPDKNEIVNAAAAAYLVADGADSDSFQDLVINFHADRFSNDGDAAAGFWFFKNQITLNDNGGFDGVHAVGDVLVVSDFNEGEGVNVVRVFTWNGTGLSEATLPGSGPVDCQAPNHNPFVCATENRTNQDDIDAVWPYTPKGNVGVAGKYPDFTFLEGGININAVLPNADECFASFLAETRSSTSPTAQLKDFVLGEFPVCAPSTTLSATPTVLAPEIAVVGDQVTFNFDETNNGNVTLTNVYVDTDNQACDDAMTPADPVTLDSGENQVFSCTITTGAAPAVIDIIGIGHGTDPIGRDTTVCDPPAPFPTPNPDTTFCDPDETATARAVTILPGTELSASANPTTTKAGDTVTFTITEGNDGVAPSGFEEHLELTSVTITASSTTAGVADDCNAELGSPIGGDTDTDGKLDATETWTYQCTVTAPADSFSLQFDGSAVALAGSSHQRTVNFAFDAEERATVPVTVIRPGTELTVRASAVITYTFIEENTGNSALTPPTPAVRESVITLEDGSAVCNVATPVTYVSGDTGNDKVLGVGESWTFTCQGSLAGPDGDGDPTAVDRSSTLTGIGHGMDATGDDVTFCTTPTGAQLCDDDERDRVEVKITHHPRGAN